MGGDAAFRPHRRRAAQAPVLPASPAVRPARRPGGAGGGARRDAVQPRHAARPSPTTSCARRARGVMSMVLCLEDAIGDDEVRGGRGQPRRAAAPLACDADRRRRRRGGAAAVHPGPRPRADRRPDRAGSATPRRWSAGSCCRSSRAATGGSVPGRGGRTPRAPAGRRLLAMPVIESPEVVHAETRTETLHDVGAAARQVPGAGPRGPDRRDRHVAPRTACAARRT